MLVVGLLGRGVTILLETRSLISCFLEMSRHEFVNISRVSQVLGLWKLPVDFLFSDGLSMTC